MLHWPWQCQLPSGQKPSSEIRSSGVLALEVIFFLMRLYRCGRSHPSLLVPVLGTGGPTVTTAGNWVSGIGQTHRAPLRIDKLSGGNECRQRIRPEVGENYGLHPSGEWAYAPATISTPLKKPSYTLNAQRQSLRLMGGATELVGVFTVGRSRKSTFSAMGPRRGKTHGFTASFGISNCDSFYVLSVILLCMGWSPTHTVPETGPCRRQSS